MKETGGGSIVNLSSVAGIIGDAQTIAYCASKGAVRLLTKSAALHCGRSGYKIRVNSVHPSFADTPMVQELIASSKNPERDPRGSRARRAARTPRPRRGGRRRDPLSGERRVGVHDRRRDRRRRRPDGAVITFSRKGVGRRPSLDGLCGRRWPEGSDEGRRFRAPIS